MAITTNFSLEQDKETPFLFPDKEDIRIECPSSNHVYNEAQNIFPPSNFGEIQPTALPQHHLPIVQHDQPAFEASILEFSFDWTDLFSDVQGAVLENPPSTPPRDFILETLTPSSGSFNAENVAGSGSDSSATRADHLVITPLSDQSMGSSSLEPTPDSTPTRRRRRVFGQVQGNNRSGRNGTFKCKECRKQHRKCTYRTESDPCDFCLHHNLVCRKEFGAIRKVRESRPPKITEGESQGILTPSRPPSIPDYCETSPEEQFAIRYIYETIANSSSYHRHREILRAIQGRNGIFIPNPCLRNAIITYSAFRQDNHGLMKSNWSKFHLSIRYITRDNVCIDDMHSFLLMTHLSRRQGAWSTVTEYLRNTADILQDVCNGRVNDSLFSETTLIETIWSARGLNRARPLIGDWNSESICFIEALDIGLEQCGKLIEAQEVYNNPKRSEWEKRLMILMLYNQDILHSIKICFAQYLRAKISGEEAHFELSVKRLKELQKRWETLEQDEFFQLFKNMDQTFIQANYRIQNVLNMTETNSLNNTHYNWTEIDPVCQDARSLGKIEETGVNVELKNSFEWFKSTSGGLRRLCWARYLRNLLYLILLERFILGTSAHDSNDIASRLVVVAAECALQFGLGHSYVLQLSLYGFSLAELLFRCSKLPSLLEPYLQWVCLMKNITGVSPYEHNECLPDWAIVNNEIAICKALVKRSHYWEF